jgi:adenosine kinase
MAVIATGSVAFDYILSFGGRFGDHIMPDKTHILNLSFLVEKLEKRRGGVASNYAYNLSLLGYPSAILATAGSDAVEYRAWLESLGIDCSGLRTLEGETTATGFTTTDRDDNQITGYYGGAMLKAGSLGLRDTGAHPEVVLIGPNAPDAMFRLVGECREGGIPWVFDPAHQLPHMTREDLERGTRGAWMLIGNDYELQLIQERTGRDVAGLLELAEIVVTTLGRQGSTIATRRGSHAIPPGRPEREADPTGAGDAYRSGLVAGLRRGLGFDEAGRIGSMAATYVVEQTGTVEHRYTMEEFAARYLATFGGPLPAGFTRAAAS